MFGLATGLYKTYFSPATLSILIIGPDCSGKTTLLERLKVTQFSTARQLRNLAASNGGTVPLPRTPSGKIRDGGGDASRNENGEQHHHKRHSSAPEMLNGTDGGDNNAAAEAAAAQTPTKEPQTRDTISKANEMPPKALSAGGAPGADKKSARRQESNASGASTSSGFRRRFLICPAPRMYSREAMEDGDDDEEEIFDEVQLWGTDHDGKSGPEESDADLDDLLGMESQHDEGIGGGANATAAAAPTADSAQHEICHGSDNEPEHEHDVKPAARMLPLHLIRPTIGQNLAKIDACGCRLNIWDLGGVPKMRPLWDRYYAEVDAVVFVVDSRTVGGAGGSGGISRLQETVESFDAVRRQPLLDGIPLMVFVNKVDRGEGGRLVPEDDDGDDHDKHHGDGDGNAVDDDKFVPSGVDLDVLSNAFDLSSAGGTGSAMGGDDRVVITAGSARTGEGVRSAFEWLVLKARNVQRETQGRDRTMTT